jgi:hypothetical protein
MNILFSASSLLMMGAFTLMIRIGFLFLGVCIAATSFRMGSIAFITWIFKSIGYLSLSHYYANSQAAGIIPA